MNPLERPEITVYLTFQKKERNLVIIYPLIVCLRNMNA